MTNFSYLQTKLLPFKTTVAQILEVIVDNFIVDHVVELPNPEHAECDVGILGAKLSKMKLGESHYQGDSRFALSLMLWLIYMII